MNLETLEIKQRLKDDFEHYASKCLRIRTKSGEIMPFVLNKVQKHVLYQLEEQKRKTGKVRALILKGRQMGLSTLIGARYYHQATHRFGCQTFILTHALDATQNLYKMAQRFHEHCPVPVRPQVSTSNSKELVFGLLESGYKVGTAENKAVGRSSTIQLFHGSEVAFWNNADDHAKGIMQAIPDQPGTECILESTANGVGNYFHQMWQKAEAGLNDFIPIFEPWYWQEEYQRKVDKDFALTAEESELADLYHLTREQIAWRRFKIIDLSVSGQDGEKAFKQEYPCNPTEAFQQTGENTYISTDLVMQARKCTIAKYGKLIMGVDPARFGDDRTCIIRREGRVLYGLESYIKKDTMEVAGIVSTLIQRENPYKVFVDVGGLGAGVIDRLHELGYRDVVVAVNAGAKPLNADRYKNKRSEMWGNAREFLENQPCQIPDSDELHADLCNIFYKFNSSSQLVMEPKEDMKKRGLRSPDSADAFCLTFAYPESAYSENNMQKEKIAANIMSRQKQSAQLRKSRHGNRS